MKTGAERLTAAFIRAREQGSHAVIPYITAGDPSLEETVAITHALVRRRGRGGVGRSLFRSFGGRGDDSALLPALSGGGTTSRRVLEAVRTLRAQGCDVPLALLVYGNILWRYGGGLSARRCGSRGWTAYRARHSYRGRGVFRRRGPKDRHRMDPSGSSNKPLPPHRPNPAVGTGFVYCVSVTGVTGARSELPPGLADFLQGCGGRRPSPWR